MSKCSFCEYIESLHSFARSMDRRNAVPECEFVQRFSAAIVEHDVYDGRKGAFVDFGYPLNFCPVCGRELAKNSAIDSPPEKP